MSGWTCPRCDRAYAPTVQVCGSCPPRSVWSYTVSSGSRTSVTTSLDLLKSLGEKKKEEKSMPNNDFLRGSEGTDVFFSFGNTAPQALRSMAEGLENAGVKFVDGLSIKYEHGISEDHEYVVTAYVYEPEEVDHL